MSLNHHILEELDKCPYLGITISNDLTFSAHINSTINKANRQLGFLRRNLRYCPKQLKETAYVSLIRSILEYGSTVWNPYLEKDKAALEMVQRRAARFVCKDYRRDSSVSAMLKELGWPSLEDRRKEARLVLLFKVAKGLVAIDHTAYLTPNTTRTRKANSLNFQYEQTNTTQFANSFFPATIKPWNQLPEDAVQSETAEGFRNQLHKQA